MCLLCFKPGNMEVTNRGSSPILFPWFLIDFVMSYHSVGKECLCIFSGPTSLSILVWLMPTFYDQHCHSVSEKNRVLKPIIPPCLPVLDLFFAGSLKTVAFPNVTWQENNPNVWRSNPNILYVFHGCCVGFPRWTRRRYPGVAWCREDSSCPSAASPVVKSAARSSPKNLKVPVKHTQNIPKAIGFEPE